MFDGLDPLTDIFDGLDPPGTRREMFDGLDPLWDTDK